MEKYASLRKQARNSVERNFFLILHGGHAAIISPEESLTLIMASVWMYSISESFSPSSLPSLWVLLTIPVVTVFCKEKGLPKATTNSPGRRSEELPNRRTGRTIYIVMETLMLVNMPGFLWQYRISSSGASNETFF